MDVQLSAILTPIYALLGAALGFASSVWLQHRNQRNEDRTRFHKERVQIYANFVSATRKCRDGAYMSARFLLPNASQSSPEDSAAVIARFNEAFGELMATHAMVQLVASKPVETASRMLFECSNSIWSSAAKGAEELNKQNALAVMAETAFITAVREELH